MAIRCKDCIYYRECPPEKVAEGMEVWMCTCRERLEHKSNSQSALSLYDSRAREEGFGYWFLLSNDPEVHDCKHYEQAPAKSLPQAKLIHKPVNWQEYRKIRQ